MSKWMIDKTFEFCYGHRVWSQKLDSTYCESGNALCSCRHLHGHQASVQVFLEGEELTRGMVTDFRHLGWLRNFLDANLDHKFIIDKNDPLYDRIVGEDVKLLPVLVPGTDMVAGWEVDVMAQTFGSEPLFEMMEGFFIVDFVPTSENFSRWVHTVAQAKMSLMDIKVARVDWFETPKSRSSFSA